MAGVFVMTIVGIILFFIVLFGVVAGLGDKEEVDVKPNSVLKLDLAYSIPERTIENPFENFSPISTDFGYDIGLNDIHANIKKAAKDENIKGIFIQAGACPNGMATLEAIRNDLIEFKKSGKFIIAYGELVSQKSYYLCSVADAVYVNPSGMLIVKGFAAKLFFLKNMLDKLGIQVQVIYDGKFKSATEPLRLDKMSPENRKQVTEYVFGIYDHFIKQIAASRGIDVASMDHIADEALSMNTYNLPQLKLADGLKFWDEVESEIKSKVGIGDDEKLNFISMAKYTDAEVDEDVNYEAGKIAVVYAEGDIVDGDGKDHMIGSADYAKIFHDIRTDDEIKAVVFRINSGGGSALASDVIWREVQLTKKKMPVIVSMGDVAASGGYFIACDADTIIAEPTTITGSIGVFFLLPNMQKFYNEKLGITFDTVKTGKYSDLISTSRPLTEDEKKLFQQFVDTTYLDFKEKVADGRGLELSFVDSIAQGRVYTGEQALKIGLVDLLGGIDLAVEIAAKKSKLTEYQLVEYPEKEDFFEQIKNSLTGDVEDEEMFYSLLRKQLPEEMVLNFEMLSKIKKMQGIKMMMPYQLEID